MKELVHRMLDEGLYIYTRWNVLFLCPPLCITRNELDWGVDVIDRNLHLVDAYVSSRGSS
jgi:taurine--2-oxoglutarate transaminase